MTTLRPVSTPGKCGCTGIHPLAEPRLIRIAPSTLNGRYKNTIRPPLQVVACWRIGDGAFAEGSAFVRFESQDDFRMLAKLADQFSTSPMSVFGHADPVGSDTANKKLSGDRARAVHALVTRNIPAWEELYQEGGDTWGRSAIAHMLTALGFQPSGLAEFQRAQGLSPSDGKDSRQTREKLFSKYMDALCPRQWDKRNFLSAGADSGGKGDYQGCGELNPSMVFSQKEEETFQTDEDKRARDRENAVNRRVVIFLFAPGTAYQPEKWPCPRAVEGPEGCRKRLFHDEKTRRSPGAERRLYTQSQDTFACRFYDRLANSSPCEGVEPSLVELIVPLEKDLDGHPEIPDHVRLRQLDGDYISELTEKCAEVRKRGDHPLNFYHFQSVPKGLFAVELEIGSAWYTVLNGLSVSSKGAFLGKSQFESVANGARLGTPEDHVIVEPDEPVEHAGCSC